MRDHESTAPPVSGFGDRLRQAREAHKLSIDEVAARLNLKASVILALEEDRYLELASAAYARGYLRGYARLLGLDTQSFIQFNKQLAIGGSLIRPYTAQPSLKIGDSDLLSRIAGCLIVAVLGFWLVSWWQSRWNDGPDKTISLENLNADSSPPLEIDAGSPGSEKIVAVNEIAKLRGSETPTVERSLPLEAQSRIPVQGTKPPQRQIEIKSTKPAWIEITDGTKTLLFYRLAEPGEDISLSGEQPFKLVLGNASEVSLRYDGELIEKNQFVDKGVARFTLDDKGARP